MGVYIRGLKAPKSCWGCYMHLDVLKCPVQTEEEAMRYCSCRHKDCPIVSVPPHGSLKDADKLVREIESVCGTHWTTMVIKRDPTIIPAEEGEEQREYEAQVEAAQSCEMYEPTYDPETGAL